MSRNITQMPAWQTAEMRAMRIGAIKVKNMRPPAAMEMDSIVRKIRKASAATQTSQTNHGTSERSVPKNE